MAEKRMFSKRVISSDAFLDMPATTQLFYFHLSMMADDDGFVDCTRSVMRSIGANKKDMDMLIEKEFVIYFQEENVSVIRHWNISNSIRSDRYKETKYTELKNKLSLDEGGSYNILEQNQPEAEPQPMVCLDQISIDQDRSNLNSSGFAESKTDDSPPPVVSKTSSSQKSEKTKKPPIREREPVNDMERVEKAYLQNWDALFSQGKVKTADPVVNFNQIRARLKKHFEKLKPDLIIQAINDGAKDDWVLDKGYSLGVMLSASVLNRLINSKNTGPPEESTFGKLSEGTVDIPALYQQFGLTGTEAEKRRKLLELRDRGEVSF
jgi:hypothetical protein